MKKVFALLCTVLVMFAVMLPAPAAEAAPTGCKVALQADTGKWFTRCRNCQNAAYEDTVTVHLDSPMEPYAQFEVIEMDNGKIALKSDLGKYVARCNNCIYGGAKSDSLTIHVTDPNAPYAQFTPELQSNGKYALKADTGKYVARCNGCSPGAAYADTVTVHETDPSASYAQWEMIFVP